MGGEKNNNKTKKPMAISLPWAYTAQTATKTLG